MVALSCRGPNESHYSKHTDLSHMSQVEPVKQPKLRNARHSGTWLRSFLKVINPKLACRYTPARTASTVSCPASPHRRRNTGRCRPSRLTSTTAPIRRPGTEPGLRYSGQHCDQPDQREPSACPPKRPRPV